LGKTIFTNQNCQILDLGGVTIAQNSVVAAGALVTDDQPDTFFTTKLK